MEDESIIFCVAYGERKKIVPVTGENDTAILANLKSKISRKFSIKADQFSLQIKVGRFSCFADIDEEDSDDLLLLRDGGDVLVRSLSVEDLSHPSTDVSPSCSDSRSVVPSQSPNMAKSDSKVKKCFV